MFEVGIDEHEFCGIDGIVFRGFAQVFQELYLIDVFLQCQGSSREFCGGCLYVRINDTCLLCDDPEFFGFQQEFIQCQTGFVDLQLRLVSCHGDEQPVDMSTLIIYGSRFGIHPAGEVHRGFSRDKIAVFVDFDGTIPVVPTGILISKVSIVCIAVGCANAIVAIALGDVPHAPASLIIVIYEPAFFAVTEQ